MRFIALMLAAGLAACGQAPETAAQDRQAPAADRPFTVTPVADFEAPWAMTFLPDLGPLALVTEKAGSLLLVDTGSGSFVPVPGTPAVDDAGQGGLMDIVPAPDFARSRAVYLSFSEVGPGGKGVALARATLSLAPCAPGCPLAARKPALDGLRVIFRATPYISGSGHYSGRIAFSPDGQYLFFSNGERQKFDPAQDPKSTLGKVLRLTLDGRPAPGNPLAAKGFHPAIWSYGHRNVLGLAFDRQGRLWADEMGPEGGDEVNLIQAGANYGWPRASNGSHYGGRDIPDHTGRDGYVAPQIWWNPSISPAGLAYYDRPLFPAWRGSLFLGGLSGQALMRVAIDGDKARLADQWDMGTRIREVEVGPDGALWLLEDGDKGTGGRLMKLVPRK